MTSEELRGLLADVGAGRVSADQAAERMLQVLRRPAVEPLGFARLDHDRALRQGFPEVVFGPGKTPAQVAEIAGRLVGQGQNLLVTRTTEEVWRAVQAVVPDAAFHPLPGAIVWRAQPNKVPTGRIVVASAGTADIPVAEEAALTAEVMGSLVDRLYDVGVAGIHRLLEASHRLQAARVAVVVAGMEGALPSVVGGLVSVPVIAVPTSVGYGAHFAGLAPLLAMLNSCAAGVAVVNIDNGFGAGTIAHRINSLARPDAREVAPGADPNRVVDLVHPGALPGRPPPASQAD